MNNFKATVYNYPVYNLDKLPANVLEYLESEYEFDHNDPDDIPRRLTEHSVLIIEHNGKIVFMHSDGGEPEDNSFNRDLYWIQPIIEQAYKFGKEDQ